MAKFGVQAMMLKESFGAIGGYSTLAKVSQTGYNAVEISQIPMTPENVAEIDRARVELGIDIAALSAALETTPGTPAESLTNDFDKIVADCQKLDCSMLRMGMLPLGVMGSLEGVLEFCRKSNEAADRLADHGIGLYYHNHHIEFTTYDGTYLLDIIRNNAPLMRFELDVHWIQRGGCDPCERP